jgi:UDPglucose 6-dehydrogenase
MLQAVGLDPRLGSRYLKPGIGYGGSCLPKDVAAVISMGDAADEPMDLMRATQAVNDLQRRRVIRALAEGLGGLSGRHVAVVGLAFKPGTNDIRESPGVFIAQDLIAAGAHVVGWDASVTSRHLTGVLPGMPVTSDLIQSLDGADAAVLCTEWPEAVALEFDRAAAVMKGVLLVDGRYGWDPVAGAAAGLDVVRIGSSRRSRAAASA